MGCFHSSGGDSSSRDRNRNRNTSDNPPLGPRTEDRRERIRRTEDRRERIRTEDRREQIRRSKQPVVASEPVDETTNPQKTPERNEIKARTCTFAELVAATENFKDDNLLGEGGFGKVYKGILEATGQIVAVKRLKPGSRQGTREFLVEALTLSLVDHPNLITLAGYCAEGAEKLLVYEFMPLGSLDDHLHGPNPNKRLDWNRRMKIAAEAARGLYYLHKQVKPPIIYRDFKTSNILLDEWYHVKLSDFGTSKFGPVGDKSHVSTRVIGTYGYCAPDYVMTGKLTFQADIYSFGVVLLELITGRKAIDNTKPSEERSLVSWARPLFNNRSKFRDMVDPALEGQYPWKRLNQAFATCAICLHDKPSERPTAEDVLKALNYLASRSDGSKKTSDGAGPSGVKKEDQGKG